MVITNQFTQFAKFTRLTRFVKFSEFKCYTINFVNSVNQVNYVNFFLFTLCYLLIFFGGCASLQQKENILAVVNGEPITEDDLKYSLQIAHRKEDLSSAGELNLSKFVQKLVDDRLIIQEARRMGMENYPEVEQAVQAYILRESVVRLYNDEIVKKVTVSENDIRNYYKTNYEQFILGIIEVDSEKKGQEILEQLKKGVDFGELGRKYSTNPSQKDGGEVTIRRGSLSPQVKKAVSDLKLGEFSEVLKIQNKYYIIKLISRKEAPDEELESFRASIEKKIRKQKEKERGDEYLKYLREHQTIKVDKELLAAVKLDRVKGELETLSKDERTLAEVNGSLLTVGDFVALAKPYPKKSKEEILNDWIDRKVVDHEALSRHYELNPDLKNMVYRYRNQLFKNTFIKRIVIPQITISDKTLEEYYLTHQKSFIKPESFKIQQITVKTTDDAQDILNSLQKGADFSWLAKNRSIDSAAQEGGDIGWFTKTEMTEPVKKIIETLKLGDVSTVLKLDSQYRIIRLLDRKEGEIEEFAKVKNAVYRLVFEEQVNTLLDNYISQLKKDADITINDEAIGLLEKKVQK
jgi:peptidyl-prolyl cis-trans isomerase C